MINILKFKKGFLVFILAFFAISGQTAFAWTESPSNPIYDPVASSEKAYYPSVVKMSDSDYRMWYQTNSTAGNTTVGYATSIDGLSWTMTTNQVSGLLSNNAGHPLVKFIDGEFKIWYWNAATPYGNNAMHYAESVDGITWTGDTAITGNLVTTASGQWNSGTYGAVDVIVNSSPSNTGTNPFNYKYAMYYDATSGGYEQIALGYSTDGVNWTLYGTEPVVPKGSVDAWDSGYVGIGSIVINGSSWTLWYSGGVSTSNDGIGCATSVDGLSWTKCSDNPIMSKTDGVAWRNSRTYTPRVIKDGDTYKMWFTGRDTALGNYTIGYSTFTEAPTVVSPDTGASRPTTIIFSGKAFPGGKISVIDKELRTEDTLGQEGISSQDGSFSVSFISIFQGLHSFGLIVKDKDLRTSQTKFFLVDTRSDNFLEKDILVPPTIDITNGQVSRGSNAAIFGYATPGYTLELYLDDILFGELLVEQSGLYKFEIPTGSLEFGQHKVRTKQINLSTKKSSDFSTSRNFIVSRLTVVKADLSGDGKVDIRDWSIFLSRWGAKESLGIEDIDFNSDGKVDIADFSIFIKTIKK